MTKLCRDEAIIQKVKNLVRERLDFESNYTDDDVRDIIEEILFDESKEQYISVKKRSYISNNIFNSLRRLGILQPILDDKSVTEIMVNGPNEIFIEREGNTHKIKQQFESIEKLEDLIQQIVSKVNRIVNESSPIVDARLDDGSRVNIVLPPIALNGPILTIRKFPNSPMTIEELIDKKSLTLEAANTLRKMVIAKYNIFISGGTGSGKTTFLNALAGYIPKNERIITIEDSAELQIYSIDNVVRLETRNANVEGKGRIVIRDLIKASLRMRPDRIIVGEVRGEEALDMLQAMNTGHDGSLSTGHANSTKDMLSRLETMVLTGVDIPLEAIRRQIASAIDVIIHLSRLRDRSRRVIEINELVGYKDGEFVMNTIYKYEEGKLMSNVDNMICKYKLDMAGLDI